MEQLKQILQLSKDGVAIREIVRRTGISRNIIRKYLARIKVPATDIDPATLSNKQLANTAYDNEALQLSSSRLQALMIHFSYAEKELLKTGVTRQLLWLEYKEQHADGYNYSQYCYHFNIYLKHKDVVMHLQYEAGDMIMIDFAGKKLSYLVKHTRELIECHVFISILPYSGLIFCKAVHSQKPMTL